MVTTTGDRTLGEGRHYDSTTSMITATQDRLQERSGKRTMTSSDYIIRLTDRLLRMGSKISDCFSQFFPLKRAFSVYLLCFFFFLPQPFLTSPFFCFSFSVSLSCSCLSFFLLVFFFCFIFVSCFCLFFICLSSLLLFSEKNNMTNVNCNLFFPSIFSLFLWFPVLFFHSNPFSLSCFFPDFKLCFCSTWMFLVSKANN